MFLNMIYILLGLIVMLAIWIWKDSERVPRDRHYDEDEWVNELHRMNVDDFTGWLATADAEDVDAWLARGRMAYPEWVGASR